MESTSSVAESTGGFDQLGMPQLDAATESKIARPLVALSLLLGAFVLLQCLMPLRTAIKVGADEGFEYAKATLALKGYQFYTEIWNDQPLLHTFIITQVLKHLSPSVLGPRLVTSAFALLLLASLFLIGYRLHGLLVASFATAFLIASPGFMELASSCMMEIPGLAPAVAALCTLLVARDTQLPLAEVLAGALFAVALQIKFIGVIYLPLAGLILLARQNAGSSIAWPFAVRASRVEQREGDSMGGRARLMIKNVLVSKRAWRSALFFVVSLAGSFFVINALIGEGSYVLQLKQSWAAHFAAPKSLEYGSPNEHLFEWSTLLKNWDVTVPAIVGIIMTFRWACRRVFTLLPLSWVALTMLVFGTHRPWWAYYYVHNAVPLCLCAAVGLAALLHSSAWRQSAAVRAGMVLYAVCSLLWMGTRIYLQIDSVRLSPRIYSSLVLKEIDRYKPFTRFIFAEEPIYSFHCGIPLPPTLGVLSLKRFWSGDLTNARVVEELRKSQPGVVLIANDSRERPFEEWLHGEYGMVYQDASHRLYARKSVIQQADPWPTSNKLRQ